MVPGGWLATYGWAWRFPHCHHQVVILRLSGDAVAMESGVSVSCLVALVVTACFGHSHPPATERIRTGFLPDTRTDG